ncbi:helix-turn-helix domain-containing protein [Nonomuraea sp. SBT364]|uniref:helix-turn-helix domain-containing protein n=1 Tax=Nonomuraea sp. SBT364 TaxID=1580530 RepID=UPI00066B54FF|nr:helix-turn-helix domain-containing protein [Nonomuraea sp. SBT364]
MTDTPPRPRPLAMSDIAALLGVSTNTVNAWRKRAAGAKQVEPLPPPAGKVATKTDYWWEDDIVEWARRTGRLKEA